MKKNNAVGAGKNGNSKGDVQHRSSDSSIRAKELVEHFESARCRELAIGIRVLDKNLNRLEALSLSGRVGRDDMDAIYDQSQSLRNSINDMITSVQFCLARKQKGKKKHFMFGMTDRKLATTMAKDNLSRAVGEPIFSRIDSGVKAKLLHLLSNNYWRVNAASSLAKNSVELFDTIKASVDSGLITQEQVSAFHKDALTRCLFNGAKRIGNKSNVARETELLNEAIKTGDIPAEKPAAKKAAAKKVPAKKAAAKKVPATAVAGPVEEATL